jgi:sugar O-acyltransferase (sialic acid O-acetyltransferase NeuD family)
MPDRLIVFGSGGHAKVVVEAALEGMPGRQIILLDDADASNRPDILGIAVSGGRRELESLRGTPVVPAIGNNHDRDGLLTWLQEQGHTLESVIHPSAIVANSVKIGPGSFVSAGAIIIAEAHIGTGAIINTGASVDHDCIIGRAVHIGPGAHLCGNVCIGDRTLVGVGSSVRPNMSVCEDVILGAGSVVVMGITEAGTFAGNPARRLQ